MKYHSKKTIVDGITFDSRAEADRYCLLHLWEQMGKISNLKLQPRYELQPAFKKNGHSIRKIEYVADFEYEKDGKIIIEDVKGIKTEAYKLKKKLFEYEYPDREIKEITKEKKNEWKYMQELEQGSDE